MESIFEEAEDVTDEREECLDECEIIEYDMSLQTVPYDTKPYEEFNLQFNLSKEVVEMFENPQ